MSRELHSQAWFDEETDLIKVKVMIRHDPEDNDSKAWKKGVIIGLTEEQLRYIGEGETYPLIASWGKEPKLDISVEKQPVYEIGCADPTFFIAGPTDFRISLDGEKIGAVQALWFDGNDGELIFIGHPGSDWIKNLPKGKCHLLVEVASEYGKVETAYDMDIVLDEPFWAMSVDDIITETTVPFTKYGQFPRIGKD